MDKAAKGEDVRIIIEPTQNEPFKVTGTSVMANSQQWRVEIEHPNDDLDLDNSMRLVARALIAYGFSKEQVEAYWAEVTER